MKTKTLAIDGLSLLICQPAHCRAILMLSHGAGAAMDSEFMQSLTQALYNRSIGVVRFEFAYMAQRRTGGNKRPPPKMPQLMNEWQALLKCWNKVKDNNLPLFIGGKSMGGRVASLMNTQTQHKENHATYATTPWRGVICFGYPFHPQKQPHKLRTEHLSEQALPVLVIQGSRDALGNKEEVNSYTLDKDIQIHWINTANHDLKPLVSSKVTHSQAIDNAAQAVEAFTNTHLNTTNRDGLP